MKTAQLLNPIYITTAAMFFLAAGTLTSVSILSAYQVLFTVSLVSFVFQAAKERDYKLPLSAKLLFIFFSVALISTVINVDIIPKPSKNFGRLKYLIFGAAGLYVFRAWLRDASDNAKRVVINTFLLSVVVTGLISFWQVFILEAKRAEGLTHTLRYGYGSGMLMILLLGALLHHQSTKSWLTYRWGLIAFIIGFTAFFITYTRGAFLGFLCGLPFLLYFYRAKLGLLLGGLAVLGVLTLGWFYLFGHGDYGSRFLVNKSNYADVIRRSQWKAAIIATQEKPVLGWGLSNFHSQLKRIKHQYDLDAKEYDDAHSHNLFLEVASGTGLVGLFFFLAWLVTWALECFMAGGLVRALVIPFGVTFIVSSQFEVTFDANNASLIFTVYSISAWLAFKNKSVKSSEASSLG